MSRPSSRAAVLVALGALLAGPCHAGRDDAAAAYVVGDALPPITEAERGLRAVTFAPGAPAVVLVEAEQTQWMQGLMRRRIFRRIKILSESGAHDFGNYERAWLGEAKTGVLAARTVRADGTIVDATAAIHLGCSKDPDALRISIPFPRVEVGAILDVLIELRSPRFPIDEWIFQQEIPVLESRFVVTPPLGLRFRPVLLRNPPESVERVDFEYQAERAYAWTYRNVPPLPAVPNRPPVGDIAAKLVLVSDGLADNSVPYGTGWTAMIDWRRKFYDGWLNEKHGRLAALAREAAATAVTPRDKAESIRIALRDRMAVTELTHFVSSHSADEALANGRGTSADLALLEVAGLRAAGVAAHPAGIRRRSSGALPLDTIAPNLFDDMIVVVPGAAAAGGDLAFSPAADRPVDVADPERVGVKAVPYRKGATEPFWIPEVDAAQNGITRDAALALDSGGRLAGKLTCTTRGFEAARWRAELRSRTDDQRREWVRDELDEQTPSLRLDAILVEGLDEPAKPLTVTLDIAIDSVATRAGDRLLLNPFLFPRVRAKDWAAEQRDVDVDMGHPRESIDLVRIDLPPGFANVQLPSPLKLDGGEFGSHAIEYSAEGSSVRASRHVRLAKTQVPAASYPPLRDWLRRVADADDRALVLEAAR